MADGDDEEAEGALERSSLGAESAFLAWFWSSDDDGGFSFLEASDEDDADAAAAAVGAFFERFNDDVNDDRNDSINWWYIFFQVNSQHFISQILELQYFKQSPCKNVSSQCGYSCNLIWFCICWDVCSFTDFWCTQLLQMNIASFGFCYLSNKAFLLTFYAIETS